MTLEFIKNKGYEIPQISALGQKYIGLATGLNIFELGRFVVHVF